MPQHHLLTTLLNLAANPDVEAFDITVWKAYLMAMYNQNVKRDIYLKRDPLKLSNMKWISTTKAFIEQDANINEATIYWYNYRHLVGHGIRATTAFRFEISAFSMLQQ